MWLAMQTSRTSNSEMQMFASQILARPSPSCLAKLLRSTNGSSSTLLLAEEWSAGLIRRCNPRRYLGGSV
jgi:hypothetical protein